MRVMFVIKTTDFIDPFGLAYLSATAKQAGHSVALGILDREDILGRIRTERPQVVAYSAVTGEHQEYFAFNRVVKERFPDIFTLMGGAHPTYYPACVREPSIDAVCAGEGETAFATLLGRLESRSDVSDIPNIHTKERANPLGPLIADLDTLPLPDRDLLFGRTEVGEFPVKTFMTSRGCPFPCTYCFEPVLKNMYRGKGKYTRRHSVDRVFEEIERVRARYPLQFIKFEDDLFALSVDEWLEEFAERYPREIGIPFNCLMRTDGLSDEVLGLLKKAGCYSINTSVDSASFEIRKLVVRKKFTNADIQEAFDRVHAHGIHVQNNMIIGLPEATIEDEKHAIDMSIACGIEHPHFTILMPYPGTEIATYCEQKGYFKMDVDQIGESLMNRSPLSCFTEKEKDIQKNVLHLGALAIRLPFLRNLVLNHLIYWRPNVLFVLTGYLMKIHLSRKYLYPSRFSLLRGLATFVKGFKIEVWRTAPDLMKGPTYPAFKPRPAAESASSAPLWGRLKDTLTRRAGRMT